MSNKQASAQFKQDIPQRWKTASWFYLLLTLTSGVMLRYQWTGHSSTLFDSRFLLHAHSHIALLGWAFFGVFGLFFSKSLLAQRGYKQFWAEGIVHLIIAGMFIAFLFQGYAFWSILLTMLHMLVTFVLIVIYVRIVILTFAYSTRSWAMILLLLLTGMYKITGCLLFTCAAAF